MTATTAGITPRGGLSRHRRVLAVLAISVALNLCFVGGALWSRYAGEAPPQTTSERFHRLALSLDLNAGQHAAFDGYVAAMLARSDRLRQDVEPLIGDAWAEIAKPQPDTARVQQLFDDASVRRRAYQHEALAATLTLLDTLTPDQRAKFVADERERRAAFIRRRQLESR
jgi:Spy/CpxP family protein refolding chaperone